MFDDYAPSEGSFAAEESAFAGLDSDNMSAIYEYFIRTTAKTPQAEKIQREFLDWHSSQIRDDWWISSEDVEEAMRRRNSFNDANAVTPTEKAQVRRVIETGFTATPAGRETTSTITIPWTKIGIGAGIGSAVVIAVKILFRH